MCHSVFFFIFILTTITVFCSNSNHHFSFSDSNHVIFYLSVRATLRRVTGSWLRGWLTSRSHHRTQHTHIRQHNLGFYFRPFGREVFPSAPGARRPRIHTHRTIIYDLHSHTPAKIKWLDRGLANGGWRGLLGQAGVPSQGVITEVSHAAGRLFSPLL